MNLLPWHAERWSQISSLIDRERLPHALLLTGPRGVGKREFAEYLANRLLCNQPLGDQPCGNCKTCELLKYGTHPDLIHLQPEEAGKVIKVDQVRETIDKLHSTAQQGGYRVLIVSPAEEMNISAANALLKTLEEPGKNTLILLVVDQLGKIMPTIRSRCQRIEFSLPPHDSAIPWLTLEAELTTQEAEGLLTLAQGAPMTALTWQKEGMRDKRASFMSGLADVLRGRTSAIGFAESMQKEDLRLPLIWWLSLIGDIVRIQLAQDEAPRVNRDMAKMVGALAQQATPARVMALYESVQKELSMIERHLNPNKQLLLERLLFDWKELRAKS